MMILDQLYVFLRQATDVAMQDGVILEFEASDCYCLILLVLPRSVNENCCSFVLFVVGEEAIDVLCTS